MFLSVAVRVSARLPACLAANVDCPCIPFAGGAAGIVGTLSQGEAPAGAGLLGAGAAPVATAPPLGLGCPVAFAAPGASTAVLGFCSFCAGRPADTAAS